jgi:hypothetical protein
MPTFAESFCEDRKCDRGRFTETVFTECLYRHAIPLVAFLRLARREFFLVDWDLVEVAADATNLALIRREIREYLMDSRNQGWWRRRANFRLSTSRLLKLAARYLPDTATSPVPGRNPPQGLSQTSL